MTRNDKQISDCMDWIMKFAPPNHLITAAALAGRERNLRIAAKAVLKASKGTDEAAMDDAIDQLREALK